MSQSDNTIHLTAINTSSYLECINKRKNSHFIMNKSNKTELISLLNNSTNKTGNKQSFPIAPASIPIPQDSFVSNKPVTYRSYPRAAKNRYQNNQHEQTHGQNRLLTRFEASRINQHQLSMKIEEPAGGWRAPSIDTQALRMEEEQKGHDGQSSSRDSEAGQDNEMEQPTCSSQALRSTMLACIKTKKGPYIEKKFYIQKCCILCGKSISKQFRRHIKDHIEEKSYIQGGYPFCLEAGGQGLQIKCKYCPEVIAEPTSEILRRHSQDCKLKDTHMNTRSPDSAKETDHKTLNQKLMRQINYLKNKLETRIPKTDKKLAGVSRDQEIEKERLNDTEKRVRLVEESLRTIEKKVDNHEDTLGGLLNHLISQGQFEKPKEAVISSSVFDRLKFLRKSVKEGERDRERSIDRARQGSEERVMSRQANREQRHCTGDRPEERRTIKREDSSRERSRDTLKARLVKNGGQGSQERRSDRRHS